MIIFVCNQYILLEMNKKIFLIFLVLTFFPKNVKAQDYNSKKSFLYADSLFVSSSNLENHKLYIDSAIFYAKKSKDPNRQLSYSYSSIAYYYNTIKEFEKSIYYFRKSSTLGKKNNDSYIVNSNDYGISLIYFQLGNYDEAEKYLLNTFKYFNSNQTTQSNKLSLINIAGRLSFINVLKKNTKEAEFYNNLEYTITKDEDLLENFPYLKTFPDKNKGIIAFTNNDHIQAITLLTNSIESFKEQKNYFWLCIIYSYLGDSYLKLNENEKAVSNYSEIKKIFKEKKITDHLIRHGLEQLYKLNKQTDNISLQLSSINNLIEFDSLYNVRNTDLSNKFYGGYVNQELKQEKQLLEENITKKEKLSIIISIILVIVLVISSLLTYKNYINKKKLKKNFETVINEYIEEIKSLQSKKRNQTNSNIKSQESILRKNFIRTNDDGFINENIIEDILIKLDEFENSLKFLDPNINLKNASILLDTNTNYLSFVINSKKGVNFPTYLKNIRINYIIKQIIENKRIRNMSMDGLAQTAGFKTRQKFSDSFLEKTGMRPSYFISNIDKIDINFFI